VTAETNPVVRTFVSLAFLVSTNVPSAGLQEGSFARSDPMVITTTETRRRETDLDVGTGEILVSRWYGYVNKRLSELESGAYDFTGLVQPQARAVSRAQTIAGTLFRPDTPTPSVVPSEDGAVVFVWHKAGWDMELEVSDRSTFVWAQRRVDNYRFSGSLNDNERQVSELLENFASH